MAPLSLKYICKSKQIILGVLQTRDPSRQMDLKVQTILDSCNACQLNPLGAAQGAVWARNAPDLTMCYAGSIGTHLRAKVQPHAPRLQDAACTQAFYRNEASLAGGSKCGDLACRDG